MSISDLVNGHIAKITEGLYESASIGHHCNEMEKALKKSREDLEEEKSASENYLARSVDQQLKMTSLEVQLREVQTENGRLDGENARLKSELNMSKNVVNCTKEKLKKANDEIFDLRTHLLNTGEKAKPVTDSIDAFRKSDGCMVKMENQA